jgi:methylenetetrahydrofolate reductase (NADPH)
LTGPTSRLEALVRSGRFCVTAEIVPPRGSDGSRVTDQARALVGIADAVNVTDQPRAVAHMSPLAGTAFVAASGLEPIAQLTCRDRNRVALIADLLGAWALGARNVLCLTGDPIETGDHPDAKEVRDLAVEDLVALAVRLRAEGRLPSGAEISAPPRYFVGVAESPLVEPYDPARLEAKLDAGAAFVQTQIVFDLDALARWADDARARGVFERAAVIVGVAPLRSATQARFLSERVPGVSVPAELARALEEAGGDAPAIGVEHAVALVRGLREIPGLAGVHVMGLGSEGAVEEVVRGAGLFPRPVAFAP